MKKSLISLPLENMPNEEIIKAVTAAPEMFGEPANFGDTFVADPLRHMLFSDKPLIGSGVLLNTALTDSMPN